MVVDSSSFTGEKKEINHTRTRSTLERGVWLWYHTYHHGAAYHLVVPYHTLATDPWLVEKGAEDLQNSRRAFTKATPWGWPPTTAGKRLFASRRRPSRHVCDTWGAVILLSCAILVISQSSLEIHGQVSVIQDCRLPIVAPFVVPGTRYDRPATCGGRFV